jgi:hypothetical protein
MDDPFKFEQLVQFRVPTRLSDAIDAAARQKCQSRSEYLRHTLIGRLQADGLVLEIPEQQYALVANGEIVGGHPSFALRAPSKRVQSGPPRSTARPVPRRNGQRSGS